MASTLCSDLSPADWITSSMLPWQQLVTFGPAGFPAYARLRFIPDPAYPGQSENDIDVEPERDERKTLSLLFDALAAHTSSAEECYFCLWEGWGIVHGSPVVAVSMAGTPTPPGPRPHVAPAFDAAVLDGPKVVVPNRAYFLFRGPLSQAGDWGAAQMRPGQTRFGMPGPAFAWPADHAWCVARDVDPHWAGVGAAGSTIELLVADQNLDIMHADPAEQQPAYR